MDPTKNTLDNELYHYGVVGMKWGIRRTPEELGRKKKTTKKKSKNQKIKEQRLKDLRRRRLLSDEELKKKTERLRLEKEFKNLSLDDLRKEKETGKDYVVDILKDVGKTTATGILSGTAFYLVKAAITGKVDAQEFIKAITPKKR